jgi:hypothetical protein
VKRSLWLAVVTVLLVTGCGESGDQQAEQRPSGTRLTASTPASPDAENVSPAGPLDELSEDDARASGVATGDYDALLQGPGSAGAAPVTLTLQNVGKRTDDYRISVKPAAAGVVDQGRTRLLAGQSATLVLRLKDDARVAVYSMGRGAEVAGLEISRT